MEPGGFLTERAADQSTGAGGTPVPGDEVITAISAFPVTQLGKGRIGGPVWSPDGKSPVGASIGIYLYDAETFEETNFSPQFRGHDHPYSPDGTTLASGFYDGTVRFGIWPMGRVRTWMAHELRDYRSYSPNRNILATTAYEEPTRLWDITSGQELRKLIENSRSARHGVSPDRTFGYYDFSGANRK
jgi:WD40 repeat protein